MSLRVQLGHHISGGKPYSDGGMVVVVMGDTANSSYCSAVCGITAKLFVVQLRE